MRRSRRERRPVWQLVLVVVLGLGYWLYQQADFSPSITDSPVAVGEAATVGASEAERVSARLLTAIAERQSKVWVESAASVTRVLADDNHGSRHQRFLVDVAGNSVLIAHNIDLAPRVPVETGDQLVVRGRFEWNEKGGVLHWTHHDPDGGRRGGWIEHRGKVYR